MEEGSSSGAPRDSMPELLNVRSIMSSGSHLMDFSRQVACGIEAEAGWNSGSLCLRGIVKDSETIFWRRGGAVPSDAPGDSGPEYRFPR